MTALEQGSRGQVITEEKGKAVINLLTFNEPNGILAENGWSSSLDAEVSAKNL